MSIMWSYAIRTLSGPHIDSVPSSLSLTPKGYFNFENLVDRSTQIDLVYSVVSPIAG